MKADRMQLLGEKSKLETLAALVGISLALWLAAGCATRDQYANQPPVYNPPASTELTGTPAVSDLEINKRIYDMFMADRSLTSYRSDVKFRVSNGVVTMLGYTPTRKDARRIAERIEELPGVVRVVNEATITWNP